MSASKHDLMVFCNTHQSRVNNFLSSHTSMASNKSEPLLSAMRYSLLNGGKRIRPLLVYASALACSSTVTDNSAITESVDRAAAAVECIHTYSLIHDDLPAMDDDDLRRGKPSCHIAFDEATAILAGDALQTLAFEILSSDSDAHKALTLIKELSNASGGQGMVAGQALDMACANQAISLDQLEAIHRHKTGAIIEAAVVMGAVASGNSHAQTIEALRYYAQSIGLAFQVHDDILDVTGATEILGKPQGADAIQKKNTYVSLLGLNAAKEKCQELVSSAHTAINSFSDNAQILRDLASYIVTRTH